MNQNLRRLSAHAVLEVFLKIDVNAIFQKCNLRRKVDFERRGYADSKGYPLELSPIAGTETILL